MTLVMSSYVECPDYFQRYNDFGQVIFPLGIPKANCPHIYTISLFSILKVNKAKKAYQG